MKIIKKNIIFVCGVLGCICLGLAGFFWCIKQESQMVSDAHASIKQVVSKDVNKKALHVVQKPFKGNIPLVLAFFDGKSHKVETITKFEGVYRGNQGCDYKKGDEEFEVLSCYDGEVKSVKQDPIFGMSVVIDSKGVLFTYQSLKMVNVKIADRVKQGACIGVCGSNVYNKELGNHLHITIRKGDHYVNPELVYMKKIEEI